MVVAVPAVPLALGAVAVENTFTVSLDGPAVRGLCDRDPALGYELTTRFMRVIVGRMQATRMRLLDMHESGPARPGAPLRWSLARSRQTWSVKLSNRPRLLTPPKSAFTGYVWSLVWKWAPFRHPNKPKRWVVNHFGQFHPTRRDRWVFGNRASGAYLHQFA